PALRYQLKNDFVSENDWIVQQGKKPEIRDFGPARIVLASEKQKASAGGNEIIFWPAHGDKVNYVVYTRGRQAKQGAATKGQVIKTGWMGNLELTVLSYFKNAKYDIRYEPRERPNDQTVSAIQVTFNGETRWTGLNSALELYTDKKGYVLTYANRRIPLGFEMKLLNFEVGTYENTNMSVSYQSEVEIPSGRHLISMNEPLKYNGLTFYQASFQQDGAGKPTTSILSVNRVPGRFLKYLGSLL